MNNRPPLSPTSSDVINSYKKRRKRNNPKIIYISAGVLLLFGLGTLIYWMTLPGKPINLLLATETPTPTVTATPTSTNTQTATPTLTETPTITTTPTFASPFNYTVQDGDYLASIVEKYNLGDDGIALIILLNPYKGTDPNTGLPLGVDKTGNIVPGQVILLPNPGMQLPTPTPIPSDLPRGTKLEYVVQSGDTVAGIAEKFNSTAEEIIKLNNLADASKIFVGQTLSIPVNLVTPTATRPPTSTPAPSDATATWTPVN
ncbi:MAG: LysM peptidoglycan-binding domain-containing protein [Anaerolineales bacterium]|nr:LysM peptidoglycan-binding domain-containing protein [Anaerolineales bacterium]